MITSGISDALDELGDLSEYLQRCHITIRTTINVFGWIPTKVGPKLAAALPDSTKQSSFCVLTLGSQVM